MLVRGVLSIFWLVGVGIVTVPPPPPPPPHPTRGNPAAKFVQPGKNPIFLALFNLECLRSVLMVKEVC